VHNLGGIANLTWLPPGLEPDAVVAFDTGPGNCLIDEAAAAPFGAEFDAAAGSPPAAGSTPRCSSADAHPYLALPFPKTTGREVFALSRLELDLGLTFDALAPADLSPR
jgi:anhydro-N-acetylmuramic acid kinase